MKIKVRTNGYWISDKSLYLDTFSYTTSKIVLFDKFEYEFYPCYINDYEYEWAGNNPFTRDEVLRLWITENARVEIFVNDSKDKTTFEIYKVLNSYETANELLLDLAKVNLLYDDVLKWFKQYVKDYELVEVEEDE